MLLRIYDQTEKLLEPGKVVVIYGPRRVGKTTLINNFIKKTKLKYLLANGDDLEVQKVISSQISRKISEYVKGYELLVIDEAQRIPDIGWGLKIIVDSFPEMRVLVTGSAALDLANKVSGPLLGRQFSYILYPLWQKELLSQTNQYSLAQQKDKFMIFGTYPEVLTAKSDQERVRILSAIVDGYLFKDITELKEVANVQTLLNLLKLIAFQIGSQVSLNELGSNLGIDRKTVQRYLRLMEQSFILYRLSGYSRNLRKEISKQVKYYFYDNGIRNAVIKNFNDLDTRNDVGQLWENWLVMERLKKQGYDKIYSNNYFWRTWDKREVDWVEERSGKLFGFEFKWQGEDKKKNKLAWLQAYPQEANFQLINQETYWKFIVGPVAQR